ncbi:hypothetical protein H257_05709 [Aphanomyces astaci]|uniref:Crinkler effector protein N-terminal domain-containing protein n=1 Tax=Aphanomyces astaci TaxID=112090 RepID=W4GP54_APHAT|nr:hypothetical protein H257_05709 [Aphanomyces astaci]ETV81106.1 hypothetical protein H257_05709 [Aphanomyces astaci]|eukprot:XP_009828964.1 hypothetical protein H257_05709 [Aphanomyces astaci]
MIHPFFETPRLFCVVVGRAGRPFSVTIRENNTVGMLKDKIAIQKKYQFPADEMDLFMTTDGTGFSTVAAAAVTLADLQDVQRFKAMGPALSIKKTFGGTFPPNEEVYVFAVAPKYASQLFCVVVGGTGCPFPVTIREDETVGMLKGKIAIQKKYQFPADEMDLFMAKDGRGFSCEAAAAVTLADLQDVQRFKAMGTTLSIKKAFGGTFPPKEEEVYVFAVAPEQPVAEALTLPKIAELGYSTKTWMLPPVDGVPRQNIPDFEWIDGVNENDSRNVQMYKEYVALMLQDFVQLVVSTTVRLGFSTPVGESRRRLTGAPDLYVVPRGCAFNMCGRTEVVMVIELKKHDTLSDANIAQTAGYLLAAHTLFDKQAYRPTPVAVLTNLRDEWHLFWVDRNGEVYDLQALKLFPAFGDTNTMAGQVKKFAPLEYEDNMVDVLETEEEVLLYQMSKRLQRTTAFDMPYAAMYS